MTENPYSDEAKDLENAKSMDDIVKTVFAPIYPLIAGQIIEHHGIKQGECIDIGSGPGALSISLAQISDLNLHALDQSPHSYTIAQENIEEKGLLGRIKPVIADVTDIPFEDDFADLIVSRGSIFFWDDLKGAFNEILRVLKPGGRTHIGGGFGSAELKKIIFAEMAKKNDGFENRVKSRMNPEKMKRITTALDESDIPRYVINKGDAGFWIHMFKE